MKIGSVFKHSKIVRKSLINWVIYVNWLRRFQAGNKIPSRKVINASFRDGTVIQDVDPNTLWCLCNYFYYSNVMKTYSVNDLITIYKVSKEVVDKLKTKFSYYQLQKGEAGGNVGPKEAILFLLIRKFKPQIIVETGVAQGISSEFILSALQKNGSGKLISIDLPNRRVEGYQYRDGTLDGVHTPADKLPGWLVSEGLRNNWDLRIGTSSSILPLIEEKIDLFFHDSEHSYENMLFELDWGYNHLNKGGIIGADDYDWNDAFNDFLKSHSDLVPITQGLTGFVMKN